MARPRVVSRHRASPDRVARKARARRAPGGRAGRNTLPHLDRGALPGPASITRRELANGLVVLARENFLSPSVVIAGVLQVGSLDETPDLAGLADLTASSLMRGTRRWDFAQIYEQLESVGASLGIGASKHTTSFHGKGLAEDLPLLLDTLAEAVRRPTFPSGQVDRLRGEKLTALNIREQDTGARAEMAFDELLYPGHPYRLPDDGYPGTVRRLAAGTLKAFHRTRYGPRGMLIAIAGAVRAAKAVEMVEARFGDWANARQAERPALPPVAPPTSIERRDVSLPGKMQCDIILGTLGPTRFDPAYLSAALGNSALGRFGLFGRIGEIVRESAGLAYYAYSSIGGGPGPDPWEVVAGVNPVSVERAIDLIRGEVRKFTSRRITAQELEDNQANFIGRLPLQLESNEGVAGALLHLERFRLGLDYYQRYPSMVRGITREHVLETARRFLDADRLVIAVAGPPAGGGA